MSQSRPLQDAILGTACGYTAEQVDPFVRSLRDTGYDGHIVLFTEERHGYFEDFERRYAIEFVVNAPGRLKDQTHVVRRWFYYLPYLRARRFGRLLLADVRDVLFQRNPFEFRGWASYEFFAILEDITIGEDARNCEWLLRRYNAGILKRLSGEVVSCAGTTFGRHARILDYVSKMCDHLQDGPPGMNGDQAAHNYLVHLEPFRGQRFFLNGLGPVLSIAPMKWAQVSPEGEMRNLDGSIAAVLHQYDRMQPEVRRQLTALHKYLPSGRL